RHHINMSLKRLDWDKIRCPHASCSELFKYEDVSNYLPREEFEHYDMLARNAILSSDPNFHYCPRADCSFGMSTEGPEFSCRLCQLLYCLDCRVEWHLGETCKAYRNRMRTERIRQQ